MRFIKDLRIYTLSEIEDELRQQGTSFAIGFDPTEHGFSTILPVAQPVFDATTQYLQPGDVLLRDDGQHVESWVVVDYTAEELAARATAQAERDAATIEAKEDALWTAADAYTSNYISGLAVGLLTIGVIQGSTKALAIKQWSDTVWSAYYRRKASITASSKDDLDFSFAGPMPYSVPELREELGV